MEKHIERDLINYLYFELNKQRFLIQDEIFEYDVQSIIHFFLKLKYKNTGFKVKREKNKTDHVIECNQETSLIEVKSFIKNNEPLNHKKIYTDILKLNKNSSKDVQSYFILVIKESHLGNRSRKYKELIECLNNVNQKTFKFNIDNLDINTRIIRSYKTVYTEKEKTNDKDKDNKIVNHIHKSQIRVFMFQLITNK